MLIEFCVQNFLSIREKQTFSLVKSNRLKTDLIHNTFNSPDPNSFELLASSVIYGANAAGKSNFIEAMKMMYRIIRTSARGTDTDNILLDVEPFVFDNQSKTQPTEFEVTIIANNTKYQYGFSCTKNRIIDEWLFAFPSGKAQRWFLREHNATTAADEWQFGSYFIGKKQVWKASTRSNSLFLSTAIMLNNEQLQPLYSWFMQTLQFMNPDGPNHLYTAKLTEEPEQKQKVLQFLKAADIDIEEIEFEVQENILDGVPKPFQEHIPTELHEALKKYSHMKTLHKLDEEQWVAIDFQAESAGTKKLFSLAGYWLTALDQGKVLFIDELHASLHPNLVKFLVRLFHHPETNPKQAQLIFTTHDTSILNQAIFRRDQIWFCKKDQQQASELYPLTDFTVRKDIENLEKAYLSGRYGSVPVLSEYRHG